MPIIARTIALLLLTASCGGARPAPEPSAPARAPAAPAAEAGSAHLPATFSRHHVFLRATVGGVPAVLLFDSGASATILSPRLVQRLGLAYRGRHMAFGIGEPVTGASMYDGTEIRIGAVQLRPATILSWANPGFPTHAGTAPDGVIGYDLLRSVVVHIDPAGGRVLALDTSVVLRAAGRGAHAVALRVTNGLPVVEADVFVESPPGSGLPARATLALVIDFGAGAGVQVSRAAAERLGFPARLREARPRQLVGIGGAVEVPEGIADSLRIGGGTIPNAVVAADTTETPSVALADAEGFIGTEILRRFAVTLDYARGRAVFEPNSLLRAPFCRNTAGICVRPEPGLRGAEVVFVDPGSTGARGGIRPGFLILSVDGAAVGQLSAAEVDRLLERASSPVLEIVRNSAQLRALTRPDVPQRGGSLRRVVTRERTGELIRLPAQ